MIKKSSVKTLEVFRTKIAQTGTDARLGKIPPNLGIF